MRCIGGEVWMPFWLWGAPILRMRIALCARRPLVCEGGQANTWRWAHSDPPGHAYCKSA